MGYEDRLNYLRLQQCYLTLEKVTGVSGTIILGALILSMEQKYIDINEDGQ